jgi:hypothetical protein
VGLEMDAVKQIEELIEAGWHVLDTDFDEDAFQEWREKAYKYIVATVGEHHPYAGYFRQYVRKSKPTDILAGGGILIATKEGVAANRYKEGRLAGAKRLF